MADDVFADPAVVENWVENENLVLIPDVPIIKVGYQYHISNMDYTTTFEDVADFVASQDDPVIHAPRIWIGHEDDIGRFPRPASGEPALGVFTNIRLSENGTMALGDMLVVKWLAPVVAVAFPNRSMEGRLDYTSFTGNEWSLVIPDIALLGVTWPGIHCLDDLKAALSPEGPDGVEVTSTESKEVAVAKAAAVPIQAQVNVDDIARATWDHYEVDNRFAWICGIFADPLEVIVEDYDGQLWKAAVTISGEDISFGEPAAVKIEYVPDTPKKTEASAAQNRALALAAAADGRQPVAVFASRDSSSRPTNRQEGSMSAMDKIKSKLRLASDATDDEVLAAIPDSPEADPDPTPAPEPTPPADPDGEEEDKEEGEEEDAPETDPVAGIVVPEGYQLVPDSTVETLQATAKQITEDKAADAKVAREKEVSAWIGAGKYPPSARADLLAAHEANPEGARALAAATPDDLIPVDERGDGRSVEAASGDDNIHGLFTQLSEKE